MKTDRLPAENLDAAGGRSGRSRYIAETAAALPSAAPRRALLALAEPIEYDLTDCSSQDEVGFLGQQWA